MKRFSVKGSREAAPFDGARPVRTRRTGRPWPRHAVPPRSQGLSLDTPGSRGSTYRARRVWHRTLIRPVQTKNPKSCPVTAGLLLDDGSLHALLVSRR